MLDRDVRSWFCLVVLLIVLPLQAHSQMLFPGDGSDEPGFVPPIQGDPPPPPPAHISSAETYIPYPPPPVTPQARSEKKRPPKPPVLFTKIMSNRGLLDWAARPNDLNNLLKDMKDLINVHFAYEIKSLSRIDVDPDNNPILYRSGHFHFSLTPRQRAKLRKYLLNGGMIILNAGSGSKPFYDSAVKELQATFAEVPVKRLGPDHPIFHSYYDLAQVDYRQGVRQFGYLSKAPWFDGVTINCRTVAVVSRWGMDIGWDAVKDDSLPGYAIDSARKLGINLFAYATAQRAWAKNVAHAMEFVDAEPSSAGKLFLAQIVYDGEWKTRHAGMSVLLRQFNQKTGVPVKFAQRDLRLSDPEIFDVPLLYITGHEDFRLNSAEIGNLRKYLKKGGLLFGEACDGRKGFDTAFRRELSKVLPGQSLRRLPIHSDIFSLPNEISSVGVTPALAALLGNRAAMTPELLGTERDGHYQVIYSPYGLGGGWEIAPGPYSLAYDSAGSIALGENILMYAITQ